MYLDRKCLCSSQTTKVFLLDQTLKINSMLLLPAVFSLGVDSTMLGQNIA